MKDKKKGIVSKIPYLGVPDTPIFSSTQEFLPIADITEDMVIFKNGGAAVVLESTSLNFSLLSEKEQQAIIFAYAALLNSLSFPIQITVRSQIKDISKYINYLEEARQKITNPKLASLMDRYKSFVNEIIKKRNVLGKSFYIVIPFNPLEMGITKSASTIIKMGAKLPFPKSYIIKKAKISLYPKRDHLITQSKRLGIILKQLNTSQLINIYYNIFNSKPPISRKEENIQNV
ncbi:MAG: hypothetical protein KatS3mg088_128 [Patescibacteria group bacterium]|nr:MAG: hypothetical protein KatS3mg088_128 [Patescibacteria group bacterium]